MAVEHSKETYLRPLNVQLGLALGLQNIQNNANTIFIILTYNTLISVGCITLNHSTFLSASFGGLVIF